MGVTKLDGELAWAEYPDVGEGEVRRVILREKELAIDIVCDGYRYTGTLHKVGPRKYSGKWTCVIGNDTYQDDASCTLYESEDGYFLFGKWREDNVNQYWWGDLTSVEHFRDERQPNSSSKRTREKPRAA